jgi:hypothetical protein
LITVPISGYALLGVRQKTTDYVLVKGASSLVIQEVSVFLFCTSIYAEQDRGKIKDLYLLTSAHTHVNNKDLRHFSFEKTPVKLFTQAVLTTIFCLKRMPQKP